MDLTSTLKIKKADFETVKTINIDKNFKKSTRDMVIPEIEQEGLF
jgi:hypothetical protein